MTANLYVFFGEAAGNGLFLWGDGPTDDGTAYNFYAESAPVTADSIGQEMLFCAAYLGLEWSMDCTLRLTPILDGVVLDGTGGTVDCRRVLTLASATTRQRAVFEMVFSRAIYDPDDPVVEVGRQYLRGAQLALRLETTTGLTTGDLIIDRFDLELEPMQETLTPVGR